jgi:hypothetical protein
MKGTPMEITWDNDEGYEIRYHVLAQRYGLEESYEKAQAWLKPIIRSYQDKENVAKHAVDKAVQARDYAARELKALEEQVAQYRKEIATQKGYYAVENKQEFATRISQLEASVAAAESSMAQFREKMAAPLPSGGLDADDKKKYAAAVKMYNLLGAGQYEQVPLLPVRYLGESEGITAEEYDQIASAIHACLPEYCGLYKDGIVIRQEDLASKGYMAIDWPRLSRTAMEILDYYRANEVRATAWGGSLYAPFGQTFQLRISASRLREPMNLKHFYFAMSSFGATVDHPVFFGYTMNVPGSFILFNDTIIVRHDFIPRIIVQSCAQPAPLPDDDDYDD